MNSFKFVGIEIEWRAVSKIHSVVNGVSTEERTSTDSQIVHTILLYSATKVGDCVGGETLSNLNGIPARDDDEFVSSQLLLAHGVQLGRVRREITDAERLEHRFHRFNIRRGPGSVEKKDRFSGGYGGGQCGNHFGPPGGPTSADHNRPYEEPGAQDQATQAIDEGKARLHEQALEGTFSFIAQDGKQSQAGQNYGNRLIGLRLPGVRCA